jgi:T3SS negative regulator,GrlR
MSVDALWTIEFETASRWTNGGVVVLDAGRIFGGDSQYYFQGTYRFAAGGLTADIHVSHYHGAVQTAFGDAAREFDVKIEADVAKDGQDVFGSATRGGFPTIHLRMKRRAALR